MFDIGKIIGLKVVALKSVDGTEPHFILFDDKKTYIELEVQDPHDYHDCSHLARRLQVWESPETWQKFCLFPDATKNIGE